jgi:hypothetical protein
MKVVHGSINIANQMSVYVRGLQELGVSAYSISYIKDYLKYPCDYTIDTAVDAVQFAEEALKYFDVFHLHWGSSFHPAYQDIPAYKHLGKKVFMNFWGSECRILSRAKIFNPRIKVKCHDEDMIKRKLEFLGRHIQGAIVADKELEIYVAPFFNNVYYIPQAIVVNDYPIVTETVQQPLIHIAHAPTDREVKGTTHILKAIRRLQSKGYPIVLDLIEGVSHDEAKKRYADADIIVDSLTEGCYGLFALECLAMNKTVVGYISDVMRVWYPVDLPIVSAHDGNVYGVLRSLIDKMLSGVRIDLNGFEYVKKYHDHLLIAGKLKELYGKV